MMNAVAHRGPDDRGEYLSSEISLGHTRLAILDTSYRGKQPMFSPDRKVVSVFNGEIYNFNELRSKYLNEYHFRSGSDAEVIPYLYEKFGIDFIHKLRGVFAIAIYDARSKFLYLGLLHDSSLIIAQLLFLSTAFISVGVFLSYFLLKNSKPKKNVKDLSVD